MILGNQTAQTAKRLVVIFDRLGPYHVARLAAVAARAKVTAIEVAGHSAEYDWRRIEEVAKFERLTLFPDGVSKSISRRSLKSKLYTALTRASPETVAIAGWGDRSALLALYWCLNRHIPTLLMSETTQIDAARCWLRERVKSRILSLVGAALSGGERSAQYLAALGMAPERIFVGYDVVDNAYFSEAAAKARNAAEEVRRNLQLPRYYFLAVNRFIGRKNLRRLLLAYARYKALQRECAWKLVILGDGPLRQSLSEQCRELRIAEDVMFPGFVQYDLLPAYYALASALVHASAVEPWGLVVNEAMAAGLPVIVSNRCGCVPELVSEGHNGFTFNPFDVGELYELMVRTSEHPNLDDMGAVSQKIVARWSPQRFAEGLIRAAEAASAVGAVRPRSLDTLLLRIVQYQ